MTDVIAAVVASRGRLAISTCRGAIRANYGHSQRISDKAYGIVTNDDDTEEWLVHGTTDGAWNSIRNQGLRCMNR
eukprot:2979255-Heterocapsa_arctica.AAC.1